MSSTTKNDIEPLIDYSYFYMTTKGAINNMHEAMLRNDYDKALEHLTLAQVELKMTYNAIQHMKEKRETIYG